MVQNVPKMAGFHCKQHVEIHHLQLQFPTQDISRRGFSCHVCSGKSAMFPRRIRVSPLERICCFPLAVAASSMIYLHFGMATAIRGLAMTHQKSARELESEDCFFADHYHIYKIFTVLWGVHKSQGTLNFYLSQLICFMNDIQETLVCSKQLLRMTLQFFSLSSVSFVDDAPEDISGI